MYLPGVPRRESCLLDYDRSGVTQHRLCSAAATTTATAAAVAAAAVAIPALESVITSSRAHGRTGRCPASDKLTAVSSLPRVLADITLARPAG